MHEDTTHQGWFEPALQRSYCALVAPDGQPALDTIVITHSMGNAVLAGAIHAGLCSLGASSRWLSVSAPWRGSKAADKIRHLCADTSKLSKPLRWLAKEMNYCNDTTHTAQTGYLSMARDVPGLANGSLMAVASQHVSAALCGFSAVGLASIYSPALEALSVFVHYGEDNDGMVPLSSCVLPNASYSKDFGAPHYLARVNHADGTMRDGDGELGRKDRQPGLWLRRWTAPANASASVHEPEV